jgi:hypothetical protein
MGNRLPVGELGYLLEKDTLGLSFLYVVARKAQGGEVLIAIRGIVLR